MYVVPGTVFLLAGLLMLIKPDILYRLTEKLKIEEDAPEPPRLLRIGTRLSGAVLLLVSILCFLGQAALSMT